MKILFFTQGDEICAASRTRVYQYLQSLCSNGIGCRVVPMIKGVLYKGALILRHNRIDKLIYAFFYLIFNYIKSFQVVILARDYDVIFIQRVLMPKLLASLLKKINSNIIFDFDDAIFTTENINRGMLNRLRLKRNKELLQHMLTISKAVIVENGYNRDFAMQFNKNIFIITGPIDTVRYSPAKNLTENRSMTIGWIGSPTTSIYLHRLKDVFRELSKRYKFTLKLVGAVNLDMPGVTITKKEWNLDTEISELRSFDIGIMPLPDDEWTKGKGGYKLLQYLSMGIPAVSTPVGINKEIVQDGINGFLVNTDQGWIERLALLMEDGRLRKALGESGRKLMEENYSVMVSFPRFLEIIKNTILGF